MTAFTKRNGKIRPPTSNAVLEATSFLSGSNAGFIEALYEQYISDPSSVDGTWRAFFEALHDGKPMELPRLPAPSPEAAGRNDDKITADGKADAQDSVRAVQLIRAYRVIGHREANLDPLKLNPPKPVPQLQPSFYGFGQADLDRAIFIDGQMGLETVAARELIDILRRTYCGTIGFEYMHISDPEQRDWLQRRIELGRTGSFTPEGKRAILNKLIEAEVFEKFCALRFVGTKRFGLDGGESMIPALEQIIKRGGKFGIKDIVLGMSHRGRLNVLANVMGKPYRQLFHEFQGGSAKPSDVQGSGDVKYHLGASSDREFDGNNVHLSLTANPSHLEAVDPVALGKCRAKQSQYGDKVTRTSVLTLLLHGDAAFAGQGVVAECFAMSGTKGFRTGGTIHFVINNQIGFTTAPAYARSSPYPSDVALMVQAPILHVNGDDPEAVVHCARIATEYRQLFHKDVVVDMFCYRRFGHNEGDEPSFTQPLMYREIKQHPSPLDIYSQRLIDEGIITKDELDSFVAQFRNRLEEEFAAAQAHLPDKADWLDGRWTGLETAPRGDRRGETDVDTKDLERVGEAISRIPPGFRAHKTIARLMQQKAEMFKTGEGIDWATGEALAFGTLLDEGFPVRLSGQDSSRGTFSQRHAALVDQETEERYVPLNHVREGQAEFEVIDSLLSEAAVVGFEYGYSLAEPRALVLWEAQFGDFSNGAQVVIDQFVASGEMKWLRMSGLVMLLPHGYEGQGPEHSSARLERFLQLCADDNMQVAYCTTPANYFHVLRRQMHRNFRKPLILMTPKSLLRHKRAVSALSEFGPGSSFHRVLADDARTSRGSTVELAPYNKIERVILCTGKVYYDLLEEREKRGASKIEILRLEQLYPFPGLALIDELTRFPKAEIIWCQEEPKNQGAWSFIAPCVESVLEQLARKGPLQYTGRKASAAPAAGQMKQHQAELDAFVDEALSL